MISSALKIQLKMFLYRDLSRGVFRTMSTIYDVLSQMFDRVRWIKNAKIRGFTDSESTVSWILSSYERKQVSESPYFHIFYAVDLSS